MEIFQKIQIWTMSVFLKKMHILFAQKIYFYMRISLLKKIQWVGSCATTNGSIFLLLPEQINAPHHEQQIVSQMFSINKIL